VVFLAVAVAGVAALPSGNEGAQWSLLAIVAVVLGPANSACNAAEYALTARYAGVRVGPREAIGVAVLSSAANLLPLPGAAVVRAGSLHRRGTGAARAARVVVAASGVWLATTAVLVGLVILATTDRLLAGAALLAVGLVGVAAAHRVADAHRRPDGIRLTAALVAVESATVAVGAIRLWLCIRGLGYDVDAVQATALTFASVLASAAGVFPGGLGLREVLASSIGPLVAVPAAVAASGVVVDRLLGWPAAAVAALTLSVAPPGRAVIGRSSPDATPSAGP
jgi:hypothetical protein